jgi:hypothetical protein
MAVKKQAGKAKKVRKPSLREEKLIEGVLQGKSKRRAALDAGYSENTANVKVYAMLEKDRIQARIAERIKESQINTNEIIGTLVSHMRGDIADICPGDALLEQAKANGVSHLIKKITYDPAGGIKSVEIHDSQSAAKSLATIHGLEKVAGMNPADVERELDNKQWAERQLADFRRDFPQMSEVEAKEILKTQAPSVYRWLN